MQTAKEFEKSQLKKSDGLERATIRSVPISVTKAKDYTNFLNISTKLNGVGGSMHHYLQNSSLNDSFL